MKVVNRGGVVLLAVLALAMASPLIAQSNVSVFATGLNNPRGLKFGPDGDLYVAEGGTGGTLSTAGLCNQVPAPVGPYTGGFTGRISRINRKGVLHTVAENLPSSQTSPDQGGLVSGVSDVQFVGDTLYALLAGAGCSHGLAGTTNGVLLIKPNGKWSLVADLSAFQQANPVANPNPPDFEPDGTWYAMVTAGGRLYAVEPNHGEVDQITLGGAISRVVDISASQGHIVPSSLAYHGADLYVGNLGLFPIVPGSANVYQINRWTGDMITLDSGFSTALGLAFDSRGRLYVLESMTAPGYPGPDEFGTGTILRLEHGGGVTTIATGFTFPTAMTFGPDGNIYVSNLGFGGPPGAGQILKVEIADGQ